MLLVLDAGNSYVKWGYHNGQDWVLKSRAVLGDFCANPQRYLEIRATHAVVGNVAGEQVHQAMGAVLNDVPVYWAHAEARSCGVNNRYTQPSQLGIDRWAALIAARALQPAPCLVVSAGTALTVDLLGSKGEFIGGAIAPGLALMRQALAQGTHAIQPPVGTVTPYPLNTADAVETGLVFAQIGLIEKMALALEASQHQAVQCVLTGGGVGVLIPYLNRPHQVVDNLVLDGLRLIAQEKKLT